MTLNLPDTISSLEDLNALSLELHEYAGWASRVAIKQRAGVKTLPPAPTQSPSAKAVIASLGKSPSQSAIDDLIKSLANYQKSASRITITLAAVPSDKLKSEIVAWCRKELAPDMLVTFRFNATILGGMIVTCKNRIFDWSFRRQILAESSKFAEVLRRV